MTIDAGYVDQTQIAALNFIFAGGENPPAIKPIASQLLHELQQLNQQQADLCLGNMGVHLREFAEVVDLTHPDLAAFQEGVLLDNPHTTKLCQTIAACKHAFKEGWTEILPGFRKIAKQGLPSTLVNIRSPRRNQQFVRLVADPALREEIRRTKKARQIQLYPFYKKGEDAWHFQPANFDLFVPGSKAYEQQIAEAKKKAARYKELGCTDMEKTILQSVEDFMKSFEKQNYHGFYRLTMTNAAIILAKMHGYTLQTPIRSNDARMLRVPEGFEQYFIFQEGGDGEEAEAERRLIEELERMVAAVAARESSSPEKKATKKAPVKAVPSCSMHSKQLMYAPTIYPLATFIETIYGKVEKPPVKQHARQDSLEPFDVWQAMQRLDSLPAFGGKPMFDHFLVMVPSPQPMYWESKGSFEKIIKNKGFSIVKGDKTEVFDNPLSAKICLDTLLVQEGRVHPIVLGERDGQCYFLAFWG